jgi:hypothetical protein
MQRFNRFARFATFFVIFEFAGGKRSILFSLVPTSVSVQRDAKTRKTLHFV